MNTLADIIDAESPQKKAPKMKMVFHFVRCEATDLAVDGDSEGHCLDKALAERAKQCKPSSVKGEIVE